MGLKVYDGGALKQFVESLEGVALQIARTVNRSLERVSLWMPSHGDGPMSANFSVCRDDIANDVRVQREGFNSHEREDVWGL